MARSEARLQLGCWRSGLAGLSAHGKLMYCVLLTDPTLNHCGVGRACLPLWAESASLTLEEAEKAIRELVDGSWVLLDETTYEVFVRTLIRNDGVAAQPFVLKGALREATLTVSPRLRVALAAELRRLPPRAPDGVSKAGRTIVYPDPHATADQLDPPPTKPTRDPLETLSEGSQNPPETLPARKGFRDPLETHPKGKGEGEGEGEGVSPVGLNSTPVGPRKRGTRLPDDFAVTADMVAWLREHCPTVDGRSETERFRDHFGAAPGQRGVKLDWIMTWRNWMRTAAERAPRTSTPRHLAPVQALPDDPREAVTALRDRADGETAARILGLPYLPAPQPPSDPTPPRRWATDQARAWIDDHAERLHAALGARETG